MSTYYTALGVSQHASATEIRQAYRRLVLLTHPDRTADPAQHRRYLAVNEAYETLSDLGRRQRYDRSLQKPPAASPPVAPPAPPAASRRRPPPLERQRGRLRPVLARQNFNYEPYAPVFRRLCLWLLLLVSLVCLDYVAPPRTVLAELLTIGNERNAAGMLRYVIGTSHGSFVTATEIAETVPSLQLRTSWLFRFVHAVRLPTGQAVVLDKDFSSVFFFTALLAVLAGAAQLPRLSAMTTVNLGIVAAMVGFIALLMALAI